MIKVFYCYLQICGAGKAICSLCGNKIINYSNRGLIALTDHIKSKSHVDKYILHKTNFNIPGAPSNLESSYGLHPMYSQYVQTEKAPTASSNVAICDRKAHMEAMVLAFVAEKSLSFSMAADIVNIAKELSKDPKVLNKIQVARTTSSYKMSHGLAKNFDFELCEKLRSCSFSLNLDEATSHTLHKILTVLVSYYCDIKKEVVVEHMGSLNVPTCTTDAIYDKLVELFNEKQLPWSNVVTMLMDS